LLFVFKLFSFLLLLLLLSAYQLEELATEIELNKQQHNSIAPPNKSHVSKRDQLAPAKTAADPSRDDLFFCWCIWNWTEDVYRKSNHLWPRVRKTFQFSRRYNNVTKRREGTKNEIDKDRR
jgi:hypothetical protein